MFSYNTESVKIMKQLFIILVTMSHFSYASFPVFNESTIILLVCMQTRRVKCLFRGRLYGLRVAFAARCVKPTESLELKFENLTR